MMLKMKGKRKKGFTLVELMVVIAIIAVLLMLAVPKLTEATKGAKVRTFEGNFRTAMSAVNSAYADAGLKTDKIATHPAVTDLLTNMAGKPDTATYSVSGGTLTGELGNPAYKVTFDVTSGELTIVTAAPDGLGTLK